MKNIMELYVKFIELIIYVIFNDLEINLVY